MGWELTDESKIRYRALFAVMRQEIREDKIDYEFLFERISQIVSDQRPNMLHACYSQTIIARLRKYP